MFLACPWLIAAKEVTGVKAAVGLTRQRIRQRQMCIRDRKKATILLSSFMISSWIAITFLMNSYFCD